MTLEELGYEGIAEQIKDQGDLDGFEVGRVIAEHRERYLVGTAKGEIEAEITGHMRYTAATREDFPAVGDWVLLQAYDPNLAIIHKVLPRYSLIKRQAIGQFGEVQVIAANIDAALIVQAMDRDLNMNRLERYLTLCHSSGVTPLIVLTKTDLRSEAEIKELSGMVRERVGDPAVFAISNETRQGYEDLQKSIEKGKTYCLLGSSGVGKSTLMNKLSDRDLMRTDTISESTSKGRHVSTHRELTVLPGGAILVDNPGMREVGVVGDQGGLDSTFDQIVELAEGCRYQDCRHINEAGCAVLEALENGDLDPDHYENYLKLHKENVHFSSTEAEKKKKDKDLGKLIKHFKKTKGDSRN